MHRQSSVSSSRDPLSESGRIKRTAILRCCRAKKRACKIGDGENGRRVPHVSIPGAPSVSSNTLSRVLSFPCFPSVALFFSSSLARRDIWRRPLPQSRVPSAISGALKPLQLQTPTVSSPLFPCSFVLPSVRLSSAARRHRRRRRLLLYLSFHSFPHFPLFGLILTLAPIYICPLLS